MLILQPFAMILALSWFNPRISSLFRWYIQWPYRWFTWLRFLLLLVFIITLIIIITQNHIVIFIIIEPTIFINRMSLNLWDIIQKIVILTHELMIIIIWLLLVLFWRSNLTTNRFITISILFVRLIMYSWRILIEAWELILLDDIFYLILLILLLMILLFKYFCWRLWRRLLHLE